MRSLLLSAALLLGCGGNAPPPETQRFALENGLRVLVTPVPGATSTAVIVLFDIGGDHDPEGRSGLGHLLEHLYVTAASGDAPARTVRELMAAYPAGHNAQTGERYTAIAANVAPKGLDAELRDAAARMGALKIEASDLDRERPRLLEEVSNMFGRIPQLGARNLAAEALRPAPRGGRKGGLPDQVKRITIEELRDRWTRYYKPGNAILSVAGACDPAAVRESVTKLFGSLPRGESPPDPGTAKIVTKPAEITVTVQPRMASMKPHIAVAYAAPAPSDETYVPFLLLAGRMMRAMPNLGSRTRVLPIQYAPIDHPRILTIALSADAPRDATLARIREFVAAQTGADLTDSEKAGGLPLFGFLLGTIDPPVEAWASNPYGLAFSLGRRIQMGIDPGALKTRLANLTPADLKAAAKHHFTTHGTAQVRVK